MGLHCNEVDAECPFDVSGFTFAGFPGVVIGHNADVAWGFTNLYPDTQDLYLEKVSDDNTYLYDGKQVPLKTREETFEIAGRRRAVDDHGAGVAPRAADLRRRRRLRHRGRERTGPRGCARPGQRVSPSRCGGPRSNPALRPTRCSGSTSRPTGTRSAKAARDFVTPAQNMVYADTAGHIGYQAPGNVPIRRTGQGDWPVTWVGIPPTSGMTSTSRSTHCRACWIPRTATSSRPTRPSWGRNTPTTLVIPTTSASVRSGSASCSQGDDALTVDDMSHIQLDDYSALAEDITPMLLEVRLPSAVLPGGAAAAGRTGTSTRTRTRRPPRTSMCSGGNCSRQTLPRRAAAKDALATRRIALVGGDARTCSTIRATHSGTTSTPQMCAETRDDILVAADDGGARRADPDQVTGAEPVAVGRPAHLEAAQRPSRRVRTRRSTSCSPAATTSSSGGPSIVNATWWDATEGYRGHGRAVDADGDPDGRPRCARAGST